MTSILCQIQILVRIRQIEPRRRSCNNCIANAGTPRRRKSIGNAARPAVHARYLSKHENYTFLSGYVAYIVQA